MSVIEIKSRIAHDEKSFLSAGMSDKSLLYLTGGLEPGSYSVDLSVGDSWNERYGPSSGQLYRIPEEGLDIGRHGSVVVEVAESIHVPHNMYGIVVPTGSLFLDKGILIAPAKVEPSFIGSLKLRLFNTTGYKHCLRRGDKIASIVFFSTENTSFQPRVTKASVPVDKQAPALKRFKRWTSRNRNQFITWLIAIFFSSVSSILISYILLSSAKNSRQDADRGAYSTHGLKGEGG